MTRLLRLVALGAGLFALASCGGGQTVAVSGPASLAPARAPFYLEAVVRPEGSQREAVNAALAKLLRGTAPREFLDRLLKEGGLTYREDVKPWLGERAGIFTTGFAGGADGALVLEATDARAAKAAIAKTAKADKVPESERIYRGTSYLVDRDGTAVGLVAGNVVAGTEAGFKGAVDASRGASLAEAEGYREAIGPLLEDHVATAYFDTPSLVADVAGRRGAGARSPGSLERQLGATAREPIVAGLGSTATALTLDVRLAPVSPAARFSTPASELLAGLPADAWGAIAVAGIGDRIQEALAQIDGAALAAVRLRDQVQRDAGIDLGADVLSWLGDAALFVRGTAVPDLQGAAILSSTNPDASLQAIEGAFGPVRPPLKLEGGDTGLTLEVPGLAQPLHVVQRGDRVVVAVGDDAGRRALEPVATLAGSDVFKRALDALGGYKPSAFLVVDPVLELARSAGAAQGAEFRVALPYLRALEYVVTASRRAGERDLLRFVVGLRESAGSG